MVLLPFLQVKTSQGCIYPQGMDIPGYDCTWGGFAVESSHTHDNHKDG